MLCSNFQRAAVTHRNDTWITRQTADIFLITNSLPVTTVLTSSTKDLIIRRRKKLCRNAEKYYQLAGHISWVHCQVAGHTEWCKHCQVAGHTAWHKHCQVAGHTVWYKHCQVAGHTEWCKHCQVASHTAWHKHCQVAVHTARGLPSVRPCYLVHTLQSGRPYCFFAKWQALCLVHSLPSGLIGSLYYAQILAHLSNALSRECGSNYCATNSGAADCKQRHFTTGRCRLRGVVACTSAVQVSVACSVQLLNTPRHTHSTLPFPGRLMLSTQWVAEMITAGHSLWSLQNRLFRLGFTVNKVRSEQFSRTFTRSLAGEYQTLRGTNRSSTSSDILCHLACEVVSGNDRSVVQQGNWDGMLILAVSIHVVRTKPSIDMA